MASLPTLPDSASVANLLTLHKVVSDLPKDTRLAIAKACNQSGAQKPVVMPKYVSSVLYDALTHDAATPWGAHPYHLSPDKAMSAVISSTDDNTRVNIAAVMMRYPIRQVAQGYAASLAAILPKKLHGKLGLDK